VANSTHGGHGARNAPAPAPTTYSNFTTTHPLLFTEAGEPLEADHWLHAIESKFGILCYMKVQKTLFIVQQLQGDADVWWANYTATCPMDYQVSWIKFRSAFRTHYVPAGVMRRKRQEFVDLKQGGRSMLDYSKLFNHLAQYAPDQVDLDEKKKDRFMIGFSTKLQEHMVLNMEGTFPEFVGDVIISDDTIRAHKETKKSKVVVAPSGSAPPKYRMVYHHGSTYPPRQPQQHQHQLSSSSGLPAHLSAHSSRQHPRLDLHLRLCYACLCHRLLEPPLATPASTVVTQATSL
jgi:hypothetical protein